MTKKSYLVSKSNKKGKNEMNLRKGQHKKDRQNNKE